MGRDLAFPCLCNTICRSFTRILTAARVSMRLRSSLSRPFAVLVGLSLVPLAAATEPTAPVGVSPGIAFGIQAVTSEIGTTCPTFSWASPPAGEPVHLAVFEIPASEGEVADRLESASEPALEVILPAGYPVLLPTKAVQLGQVGASQ